MLWVGHSGGLVPIAGFLPMSHSAYVPQVSCSAPMHLQLRSHLTPEDTVTSIKQVRRWQEAKGERCPGAGLPLVSATRCWPPAVSHPHPALWGRPRCPRWGLHDSMGGGPLCPAFPAVPSHTELSGRMDGQPIACGRMEIRVSTRHHRIHVEGPVNRAVARAEVRMDTAPSSRRGRADPRPTVDTAASCVT